MPKINDPLSPSELRLNRSHLREIRLGHQTVGRLVFEYSRYDRVIEKKPLETYEPLDTSEDEIQEILLTEIDYWRIRLRHCQNVEEFREAFEELLPELENFGFEGNFNPILVA